MTIHRRVPSHDDRLNRQPGRRRHTRNATARGRRASGGHTNTGGRTHKTAVGCAPGGQMCAPDARSDVRVRAVSGSVPPPTREGICPAFAARTRGRMPTEGTVTLRWLGFAAASHRSAEVGTAQTERAQRGGSATRGGMNAAPFAVNAETPPGVWVCRSRLEAWNWRLGAPFGVRQRTPTNALCSPFGGTGLAKVDQQTHIPGGVHAFTARGEGLS